MSSVFQSLFSRVLKGLPSQRRRMRRRRRSRLPEAGIAASLERLELRELLAADLVGFSRLQVINGGIYHDPNATFGVTPQPISWGQTANINLYIANIGNADSGPFLGGLYLSTDPTIDSTDIFLGNFSVGSITTSNPVVGGPVGVTMPASRPEGPIGNYYVGMILDVGNVVVENNEANNSNQGGGRDRIGVSVLHPIVTVTDSVGSSTDHTMDFGSIVNDGTDNAQVTYTVTLSDSAAISRLKVAQNGVRLADGSNFQIVDILSSQRSQTVNVAGGSSLIAANNSETWTIQVAFDPNANGSLTDTLIIETDDPANPIINVALSGIGTPLGNIAITDSIAPAGDRTVNVGDVAVDGVGGASVTATVTLTNNGSGPITVDQNGIFVDSGPFTIESIISSTQGAINLAAGAKTLAEDNTEAWTVTVRFDPTATGLFQQPLTILSSDEDSPSSIVTLVGMGKTPPQIVVTDSVVPNDDLVLPFGDVHADGVGLQLATQTVSLTNDGEMPLILEQDGISLLTGTQYSVGSVTSDINGLIDLSTGTGVLAPNASEVWTVELLFDPILFGSLTDTLQIASNDPATPETSVSLTGSGDNKPELKVTDTTPPPDDNAQAFPATLNDGTGGKKNTRTLQLSNIGNVDLVVSQDGITTLTGEHFRVASIVSTTAGSINLATGSKTLLAREAEIWTLTLEFDPTLTASVTDTLRIASNDPVQPTSSISLSGDGVVPEIATTSPAREIHASAGQVYSIDWAGQFEPGDGVYSLFFDTDRNPDSGLVPIATDLPQKTSSYRWHIPESLVGGTYTIYVAMNEEGFPSVTAGDYAEGSIAIDALGTDRLLSASVTDESVYTLTTNVDGTEFSTTEALVHGDNILYQTAAGETREYRITQVATLVDADHTEYDELGNVTATTDSDGRRTVYEYDFLSRLTRVEYPDRAVVDYEYDPAGNLVSMHDDTGWQLYGYDVRDRLTSVVYSPENDADHPDALTIGYEYDLTDRLTALDYPSGKRVEYGYTAAGKLNRVTEINAGQADLVTTYDYHPTTGLLEKTTLPNGIETIYGYDVHGRLDDIHHRRISAQATVLRYEYTFDAAGRRTQVVVTSEQGVRAEKYGYDDFNRLEEVTYSNDNGIIDPTDRVVRYTYDRNGNRLTQTTYATGFAAGVAEALIYAYGFENRLVTVTDQNGVVQQRLSYDQRGNRIQKVTPERTTHYRYDDLNLLAAIFDGTNAIHYQYDGAGRRVGQTINGTSTRDVVAPNGVQFRVLETRAEDGNLLDNFLYGRELIGSLSLGSSQYLLEDAIGSVVASTSGSGEILENYRYGAFGEAEPLIEKPPRFGFAGQQFESLTGLSYLRARMLDHDNGQFISKDPLLFADSLSSYTYVGSDPVNRVDPTGTQFTTETDVRDASFRDQLAKSFTNATFKSGLAIGFKSPLAGGELAIVNAEIPVIGEPVVVHGMKAAVGRGKYQLGYEFRGESPVENFDRIKVNETKYSVDVFAAAGGPTVGTKIPGNDLVFGFQAILGGEVRVDPIEASKTLSLGLAKVDLAINDTIGYLKSLTGTSPTSGSGNFQFDLNGNARGTSIRPGGVILDKAASLIGANLSDIAGASFDPVTGQLVFLGAQNPGTVSNIDLDLFATAIQSVFGSAVPPYVTLDPPANLVQNSFDIGSGDGVIPNGKSAPVLINYTPFSATNIDDMVLTFEVNGSPVTARIDAQVQDGNSDQGNTFIGGGRFAVMLRVGEVTGLPAGITFAEPDYDVTFTNNTFTSGGTLRITIGSGFTLEVNAQGQASNFFFELSNASGGNATMTNLQLVPDRQHRKFGGRVDNTRLGWIIEEADRVMKALGIGKDHLTGADYTSSTAGMPAGYQNLLERYSANSQFGNFNNRFWFTPDEQTLKRYIDPVTGEATVVFDSATAKLNTEALVLGQSEDIAARAWADFFNENFDEFAEIEFPVYDPDDPTHTNVTNVKIFGELRNAMKAVSLARFFKDNNIPLDTWWLNSYESDIAYTPQTIPTLTNSLQSGAITLTMHGGVTIKTPNTYLPDVVAKSIADAVRNQRPAGAGDLAGQAWDVDSGTSYGGLKAVATTLDDQKQDANVTLTATDLSFPSAGGRQLSFNRFYNSGYLVDDHIGRGWRPVQFDLQFQLPSFVDDGGLMRDANGDRLNITGADSDTQLRSGEFRIFDHATGSLLSFQSSLTGDYDLDSQQNPIFLLSGLNPNNVPDFTPGVYRDGSTLTQDPSTFQYTLTRTDGSSLVFDAQGKLLQDIDSRGFTLEYNYTGNDLSGISDSVGQLVTVNYGTDGRVESVVGPEASGNAQRKAVYVYDAEGRLTRVDIQALQPDDTYLTARNTQYNYNADDQLTGVTGPDGVKTLTSAIDLTGRTDMRQDQLGNMLDFAFSVDIGTGERTTQTMDMGTTGTNDPTAHGLDAIRYFVSGSTNEQHFDSTDRTTMTMDALGNMTSLGYTDDLQAPTSITLPTEDRPSISIQRNALSLPTVINDPANVGATPTQITYTVANKPDTVTDSKGRVTKYTYTEWNDIETVTIAFGTSLAATTTYNYNARKLHDNIVDPLGRTVQQYGYDAFDRVTSTTDADGIVTTVTYDTLGRVKRVFDPRLTGTTNFTEYFYNDNDQITRIATPTGDIISVYDPVTHRLTSTTDLTGNTTQYGYSASGQLTSETQVSSEGNAVTQYEFGRRGDLVALIAPEGHRTSFRADVLGRPTDVIEDDGVAPNSVTGNILITSGTAMTVQVRAAEPILVASLNYWQQGQSAGTAQTQFLRLNDETSFVFSLADVDTSKAYLYELTMTDRVGLTQTVTDFIAPAVTSLSPADDSANIALTSNLVMSFSEDVAKGMGNIQIRKVSDDSVVQTIAVSSAAVSISGAVATIDPTDLASSTDYYVTVDSEAFKDLANITFAGITGATAWNFTTADDIAPTIVTLSPADDSSNVAVTSNLVMTFSEEVAKGTGNILIKRVSDNTIVQTIDVTSAAVSVSETVVTIDPTNLAGLTGYYVEVAATTFKDISNIAFAGINGATAWNFTTVDTSAPTVVTFSPADNATDVPVTSNLVVTFNEDIVKGTGNIQIRNSGDDSVVQTIAVSNTVVTISGAQVTIDLSDLASRGDYYVTIDATAFKDLANNPFAGISDKTIWDFTTADTDPPTLVSLSPADNATNVAVSANLVMTFSENIAKNTGDILIKRVSDNAVVHTIDVMNAGVLVSGAVVTIDPTDLAADTGYYVEVPATAFKDMSNNAFAGISGTAWHFATVDTSAPTVVAFSPVDNATSVPVSSNLIVTFNESVVKATGNIRIRKTSDDSIVQTIAVSNAAVTVSGAVVTINPADLASNTDYYVTIDAAAFKDSLDNNFTGISEKTTWNFTTADVVGPMIVSLSPADNATNVALASNLVITFNENITKGTGNILIRRASDDSTFATIDVNVAQVSVSNDTVTINHTVTLESITEYYIQMANGTVTDIAGNANDGINGTTSWSFTTVDETENLPPTDIMFSNTTVPENQPAGTTIGTLTTSDPDSSGPFTYALVLGSVDNSSFSIDSEGNVQTAVSFDFEDRAAYAILVRSTDDGGLSIEKQFTVSVTDVNEKPTHVILNDFRLQAFQPVGTIVGTLTTEDPDSDDHFTYQLVTGAIENDNDRFTVDDQGNLRTSVEFNEPKNPLYIQIRATDQGGLYREILYVTAFPGNQSPTDISLSANTVASNTSIGSFVGAFSTVDPDSFDKFTYTLVPGDGSEDNAKYTIDGEGNLRTSTALTPAPTHSIRVRTTDLGGLSTEKAFEIHFDPMPDVDLTGTSFAVADSTVADGTTPVTFTVTNAGTVAAGGFATQIVFSPNTVVGDADDVLLPGTLETVTGLAEGESATRTVLAEIGRSILFSQAVVRTPAGQPVGTQPGPTGYLFLIVDVNDDIPEPNEANNSGTDLLTDIGKVIYFPWDANHNGTVEPLDALGAIQAIGTSNPMHDFDGNGIVTPLEALSAIQRIGYIRESGDGSSGLSSELMVSAFQTMVESAPVRVEASLLLTAAGSPQTQVTQKLPNELQPVVSSSFRFSEPEEEDLFRDADAIYPTELQIETEDFRSDSDNKTFEAVQWLDVI